MSVLGPSSHHLGPIRCLVNNAGINLGPCLFKNEPKEVFNKQYEKSLKSLSQNWMKVMNVNTIGMMNVTSAIFPLMAARKCGHVVNISSVCVSHYFL